MSGVRLGKPDWCLISPDGTVCVCARVESNRPAGNKGAGWIHRLSDPVKPPPPPKPKQAPIPQPQMARLAVEYFHRCKHPELLAGTLGIRSTTLRRLGMGYDGLNWSFPMFNERRQVVGIKLRPPVGRKFCVPGSHLGINWPKELAGKGPCLVCEGETDTGAALDMGFDAVGRPSCSGGVEIVAEFLRRSRYEEVWIFADRDTPGIEGADRLAGILTGIVRRLKVIHCPQNKDIRSWYNAGATRAMLESLAANTGYWSV